MISTDPVLRSRGLRKEFPGQVALSGLDLDLYPGQVHSLVGSNGSGKSTFIKMIAGSYEIDSGSIEFDQVLQPDMNPARAYQLGLRFLHQKPSVFATLTVAENIGVASRFVVSGRLRTRPSAELLNAREALTSIGVDIDPQLRVSELSPVGRTMVAVAAALQQPIGAPKPRILVLDEPTAALPEHEVELVFDMVRRVTSNGIAVLYVSHRLPEIFKLADVVTVLRDGVRVHHGRVSDLSHDDLVQHIVGHASVANITQKPGFFPEESKNSTEALKVDEVCTERLASISMSLAQGEIVGVAGLLGSGRSELLRVLAGAQRPTHGSWRIQGRQVPAGNIREAIRAGIAHVPEDRLGHGIFTNLPASTNALLPNLSDISRHGRIVRRDEYTAAQKLMDRHDITPRNPSRPIGLFSGGNQQKLVIGRWLRLNPLVLLLDEPTQAVDVEAKAQIHQEIHQYASSAGAVLMVSSDFAELADVCDRVLVIRSGRMVQEMSGDELSEERILHAASWEPANDAIAHS